MDVVYKRCAGLDVHKKTVVASVRLVDEKGAKTLETRSFATMTGSLLALGDWLRERGCTHVALESTGDYWKPIYNILEGDFELVLVNTRHVKMVPGRKTDINDAQWLADLLQHGLVRGSFVPAPPQRALRSLTRTRRSFVQEKATICNRIQKLLEDANIKLAVVASDVLGVSGRAMLHALAAGRNSAPELADLAKGRLRQKLGDLEQALAGNFQDHHRLILQELLLQVTALEASIARLDEAIAAKCAQDESFERAVALIITLPGVARATAEVVVSEIGTDMSRFPTAGHLSAWGGVAPGNNVSGGKRLSGHIRPGNTTLRTCLVQAAHAAARTKDTYLAAQYKRLAPRRGNKRAVVALAHTMLEIIYYMLSRQEPYREMGGDYFDRARPEGTVKRLTARLQNLGFEVILQPTTPSNAPVAA